jgi:hypothetical protein
MGARRSDASGQELIAVKTADLVETANGCAIDRILFLTRSVGEVRLVRLDSEAAYGRLLKELPVYASPVHEAHKKSLRTLASLAVHELRYSDLGEAVQVMNSLGGEDAPIDGSSVALLWSSIISFGQIASSVLAGRFRSIRRIVAGHGDRAPSATGSPRQIAAAGTAPTASSN